jgi:hypothetical protein
MKGYGEEIPPAPALHNDKRRAEKDLEYLSTFVFFLSSIVLGRLVQLSRARPSSGILELQFSRSFPERVHRVLYRRLSYIDLSFHLLFCLG